MKTVCCEAALAEGEVTVRARAGEREALLLVAQDCLRRLDALVLRQARATSKRSSDAPYQAKPPRAS